MRCAAVSALGLAVLLAGCSGQTMVQQPKLTTYSEAQAFPNNASARPVPADTIDRDALARAEALSAPPEPTSALLERGRERYGIFCAPCHGATGHGDGMIVERGFPQPPSYHLPRLLAAPAQHYIDVITNGRGVMYPYAARIHPADRWAIVAYIRALQRSQNASLAAGSTGRP